MCTACHAATAHGLCVGKLALGKIIVVIAKIAVVAAKVGLVAGALLRALAS
jgi:hypothetical protein